MKYLSSPSIDHFPTSSLILLAYANLENNLLFSKLCHLPMKSLDWTLLIFFNPSTRLGLTPCLTMRQTNKLTNSLNFWKTKNVSSARCPHLILRFSERICFHQKIQFLFLKNACLDLHCFAVDLCVSRINKHCFWRDWVGTSASHYFQPNSLITSLFEKNFKAMPFASISSLQKLYSWIIWYHIKVMTNLRNSA